MQSWRWKSESGRRDPGVRPGCPVR